MGRRYAHLFIQLLLKAAPKPVTLEWDLEWRVQLNPLLCVLVPLVSICGMICGSILPHVLEPLVSICGMILLEVLAAVAELASRPGSLSDD